MNPYQLLVVGAGIVGLATAREAARRHPGWRIAVVEAEGQIAPHQSSHNSGVIHSGIYYRTGSAKAVLSVRGGKLLRRYCADKGIAFQDCGKVIVAAEAAEIPRLERLMEQGRANGIEGLRMIEASELKEIEPHCRGLKAIFSPTTGIVDYQEVASSLAEELRAQGHDLKLGRRVERIESEAGRCRVLTAAGELQAEMVVACAGVQADRLARRSKVPTDLQILPFRGDYWRLKANARELCRNLIYPVPDPHFPFLGVHATRRIQTNEVWLGPNAVPALSRTGYGRLAFSLTDALALGASPGFRRLAASYWKTGGVELWRDWSRRAFVASVRRYLPEVGPDDVEPGPSGIRAQPIARDGSLIDDFVILNSGRQVHVLSAPSPAATSSLAIAEEIVARLPAV